MAKNEDQSAAPVIIEAAINGATPKERNPNVPISAEEITADALACLEAGAAIIHAHCNPVGGPDVEVAERYLEAFEPVWQQRGDALLYPTVNFGSGALSFGHLAPMAVKGLRVGLLDPGSAELRAPGRGRAAHRSLRLSELLRPHRRDLRAAREAPARPEPGDLRARIPARDHCCGTRPDGCPPARW